jgi:predicted O-methyltransferase YrrM
VIARVGSPSPRFTRNALRAVLKDPRSAVDFLRMRPRLGRLLGVRPAELAAWEHDLLEASGLFEELRSRWTGISRLAIEQYSGGSSIGPGNEILYLVVRAQQPEVVVETGVAMGFSSAHLLQALEDNGRGHLYSIDLPSLRPEGRVNQDGIADPVHVEAASQTGAVVPPRLRGRWTLQLGSSSERLAPLLATLPELDLFFHDSDHSYANMRAEFELAWGRLRPGGLLLSDDIGWNSAFDDFCAARAGRVYRGFQRGIALKPGTLRRERAPLTPR